MILEVTSKGWAERRNGYTQEMLRLALGIGSRQTDLRRWSSGLEELHPPTCRFSYEVFSAGLRSAAAWPPLRPVSCGPPRPAQIKARRETS